MVTVFLSDFNYFCWILRFRYKAKHLQFKKILRTFKNVKTLNCYSDTHVKQIVHFFQSGVWEMQNSTKSGLSLGGQEIWGNQGKNNGFRNKHSINSHFKSVPPPPGTLPASPQPERQMPRSRTYHLALPWVEHLVLQYLDLSASQKQALVICPSLCAPQLIVVAL